MTSFSFKKLIPHAVAVLVFLLTSVVICKPSLEGKKLHQSDIIGWKGMSQQSMEYKEKNGHFPLWTNSMFSGMPTYQIAMDGNEKAGKGIEFFGKVFSLFTSEPVSFFFLAALCFYILCVVAGINPWLSILGGLSYALATYNPIIIVAGHNTKMMSIAYAPMIFAGLLLLFQRKYLVGFTITAFFATVLISQNHLQIVYYTLLITALMTIVYTIHAYREKQLMHALKSALLGLLAGAIGLGATAINILPTYDYSKETMRGGASQLTLKENTSTNKTKNGLDKDYAFRWSMGKMETFTFMVPGLYGGSNGGDEHDVNSRMVQKLTEIGVPEENAMAYTNGYSYWGAMSSMSETTSGPAYLGAVVCFLFIFGLIYFKGWEKWWLLSASILGILLGWGNNFMVFNSFMIDYFPFLNKFRAPSMAMVIPQFCFLFLGILSLNQLFFKENDWNEAWKKIKLSTFTIGGVFILLSGFYALSDYTGKGDEEIKQNFTQSFAQGQQTPEALQQATSMSGELMKALRDDRKSEAGRDIFRSLIFIALAFVILYLYYQKKINAMAGIIGLIILSTVDLIGVDSRYLNESKYSESSDNNVEFSETNADIQIKTDPDHANFRVFNTTGNFTNESNTSYFHNSIGGYHPAKLGLYQDLIEYQISKGNMQVLNMLNTKYFIVKNNNGQEMAQMNPNAFGNCWLVKGLKFVSDANAEMKALDNTNLRDSAVINNSFKSTVSSAPQYDSAAFIKVRMRDNDDIIYDFKASSPQFAVFSEVYYNRGWDAYIDNKKVPYSKVNYVLRGLSIPAGKHTIEFKFEPKSYYIGKTISFWCTILLYVLAIATIYVTFKNYYKKTD